MSHHTFRVMSGDVDPFNTIRLNSLLGYLHESGWRDVEAAGLSFHDLKAKGLLWVVRNFRSQFFMLPVRGQQFTIVTWIRRIDRVSVWREFRVLSTDSELLGIASGQWLILDFNTRTHTNPLWIQPLLTVSDKAVFEKQINRLPAVDQPDMTGTIKPSWSDLDFNNHVNSLSYIRWIHTLIPETILRSRWISEFHVTYLRECYLNDELDIRLTETSNGLYTLLASIINRELDFEAVRMKLGFAERNNRQ